MITAAAAAASVLLLQAAAQPPRAYVEVNTTFARSCSVGAMAASHGKIDEEALADCNRALNTEPLNSLGMAQTLTNRGVFRFASNNPEGAMSDFNEALKQQPDFAQAYLNRAGVYLISRDFTAARADADKAVQLDAQNARAWLMRGGANEMLGRTGDAYRDYQMAAKLDPSWEQPKTELARFKVKK